MNGKEKFHCHQAATKGLQEITEDYCLTECDSPQKGVKSECPPPVRPQPPEEGKASEEELRDLASSITNLEKPEMSEEGKRRGWERIQEAIERKFGK